MGSDANEPGRIDREGPQRRISIRQFFLSGDGRIMVASYTAPGDRFSIAKPSLWSDRPLPRLPTQGHDLAPDGKHAVAILEAAATGESETITVLLNFFDELRRRVPGGAM